ncbi:MAG: hypothetical protein XD63_0866 [Thermoanaerobacterales bacterium 50_218]|nr:MAG: hypothetical protein XD63_0866 [Thermoanaerobacterales bacterium 50_218]HAA89315.1 uroporphyrinogen decarboxylase [Peptococcaceae bacterium]
MDKVKETLQKWCEVQGIEFSSAEAEERYKKTVQSVADVIQLKTPAKIPVYPFNGFFPAYYAGFTPKEVMYDFDKAGLAWEKYLRDLQPDLYVGPFIVSSGKVLDIVGYKIYKWPGNGLPDHQSYQYIEAEYVKAEEYDDLCTDPTDFMLRKYLPRVFTSFEGFASLPRLFELLELPLVGPHFIVYGAPPVKSALEAVIKAGEEALRWGEFLGSFGMRMASLGFVDPTAGMSKAPFDVLGDTFRGTRGIMMDMFRCPERLLEALERITPIMIQIGLAGFKATGKPFVFIPLHKGADGFMSDSQFKEFYWPTLKKLILGLVEEGAVPFLFAEGGYNSRLEVIRDIPKGTTVWLFDETDMVRAKEVLGDVACIAGNVPISLLYAGTPEEVKDYCKKLINSVGKDGGFILGSGAVLDEAKPENVKAMIEVAKS